MAIGLLPHLREALGAQSAPDLAAGQAFAARLGERRPLAQRRLGHGERQRALAHAVGPVEQKRRRQPIPFERAAEDRAHAVVAADVREPQAAAPWISPRRTSPRQTASMTSSAAPRASTRSQRSGSSAASAS